MNQKHIIFRMAQTIAELQDEIHQLNAQLEFANRQPASEAMNQLRRELHKTHRLDPTSEPATQTPLKDFLKNPTSITHHDK